MYSGRHTYQLAREHGSFRIKMKRVDLVNCDGVACADHDSAVADTDACGSGQEELRSATPSWKAHTTCFPSAAITRTTLLDIAEMAGTGVSSLYSYFPSKLHLLYAVVEPWQKDASNGSRSASQASPNPRERLRAILLGIWRDIPNENIGLANSLMEALASADPGRRSRRRCCAGPKSGWRRCSSASCPLDRAGADQLRPATELLHDGL